MIIFLIRKTNDNQLTNCKPKNFRFRFGSISSFVNSFGGVLKIKNFIIHKIYRFFGIKYKLKKMKKL